MNEINPNRILSKKFCKYYQRLFMQAQKMSIRPRFNFGYLFVKTLDSIWSTIY